MVPINGTTVSFHALEALWPGMYKLAMKISDAQGLSCPDNQNFEVEVCKCEKKGSCGPRLAAQRGLPFKIGIPAIGLFLSGAALLLLAPFLLIFCQCGTVKEFTDLPFYTKESLIAYHTEGIGEDKEVPLLSSPVNTIDQKQLFPDGTISNYVSNNVSSMPFQASVTNESRTFNQEINKGFTETDSKRFLSRQNTSSTANHRNSALYSTSPTYEKQDIYQDMAVGDAFLNEYFSQKASCLAVNPPLKDGLVLYEYEGQGSPAGSVGRCSLLESDSDLEFLNNLGSKFLTLAELCHPPKPPVPPSKTEQVVKSVETSFKTERSISTNTVQVTKTIPPPQEVQQSSVTKVEMVNKSATLPGAKASEMCFVQQQPLYYLVEQQVPNTVFVESPNQGLYVINGNPGTEGLILQGGNISHATLSRGQQAMYVINGAPVAANQPIQLQMEGQQHETVLGFSPVSSPIGSPGGVLLMQTHFQENPMQGATSRPPTLLADVPALGKQKKGKTPAESLGTKEVKPQAKDTAPFK